MLSTGRVQSTSAFEGEAEAEAKLDEVVIVALGLAVLELRDTVVGAVTWEAGREFESEETLVGEADDNSLDDAVPVDAWIEMGEVLVVSEEVVGGVEELNFEAVEDCETKDVDIVGFEDENEEERTIGE